MIKKLIQELVFKNFAMREYKKVNFGGNFNYNRINVVGTSGSGKTTFSKSLSRRLGIEHIEIDSLFWGPNWYWPSDDEFFPKLQIALEGKDKWILDGNYTRTIPIKWEKVEVVIWLDYSFTRTFFQAVKRAISRSLTKEELWEGTGNRESLRNSFFDRNSIILWTIKTYKKTKKKYQEIMQEPEYSYITFIRIKSPKEAKKFLKSIDTF